MGDCEEAIRLDKKNSKAYVRCAKAHLALGAFVCHFPPICPPRARFV